MFGVKSTNRWMSSRARVTRPCCVHLHMHMHFVQCTCSFSQLCAFCRAITKVPVVAAQPKWMQRQVKLLQWQQVATNLTQVRLNAINYCLVPPVTYAVVYMPYSPSVVSGACTSLAHRFCSCTLKSVCSCTFSHLDSAICKL